MMNKKIIFGMFCSSLIVLILAGYSLFSVFNIAEDMENVRRGRDISRQILIMEVESYRTQFVIWQYFYDPSRERFLTMMDQIERSDRQSDTFLISAQTSGASLYNGGLEDAIEINKTLEDMKAGTKGHLEKIIGFGEDVGDFSEERNQVVLESEKVYYSYDLDDKIKLFSQAQILYIDETNDEIIEAQQRLKAAILAITGVYMILLVLIAIWLGQIIKETNERYLKYQV